MKNLAKISALVLFSAFALQAQPKYTKMTSNQSAYKVKDLSNYKETGVQKEDRNPMDNATSYKNASKIKPEASELFPVLPTGATEQVFVSSSNYKSQFKATKKEKDSAIVPSLKENESEAKPEGVVLGDQ